MRLELLRLKIANPDHFRDAAESLIAEPKDRPGRLDWRTWVVMRATMNARSIGAPAAAKLLTSDSRTSDPRFSDAFTDEHGNAWPPRKWTSILRDYNTVEERRKSDSQLAEQCARWLPGFEAVVRKGISAWFALAVLEGERTLRRRRSND